MNESLPGHWRTHAACRGLYGKHFFLERGESSRTAQEICVTCPVTVECLDDAIERKEIAGVRAGLSTRQRRKLIKDLNLEDIA